MSCVLRDTMSVLICRERCGRRCWENGRILSVWSVKKNRASGLRDIFLTNIFSTKGVHVIEQAVEVANAVAYEELPLMLPWLPVSEKAERYSDAQLVAFGGKPFVILNPGAGWGAKRWPTERYGEVARLFAEKSFGVVINFGPGEEMLAGEVKAAGGNVALTLSPALDELIALTRRASLVVAGDTGPLHLASALGKPVVGIFGPTDPARNGPFGGNFRVLRHPESKRDHSRRAAPEAGLLTISPDEVWSAAMELLEDAR